MDSLLLIFPPIAGPTYAPLGIASLSAYLGENIPSVQVTVLDLNIAAWKIISSDFPQSENFWNFMQGRSSGFLQEEKYLQHQGAWSEQWDKLRGYQKMAQLYLNKGTWIPALDVLFDQLLAPILNTKSNIIGFSAMYLDQVVFALAMAKKLSESPFFDARVILGGAAMSALHPAHIIEACPFIYAAVTGEGESPLINILRGQPLKSIPGVFSRENTSDAEMDKRFWQQPGLPVPDFSGFDLAEYANPAPVLAVTMSRDCQWHRCRFCAHNFSFGGYREKTIISFVDEIEGCSQRFGARHFYIADQYVSARRLERLSAEILKRKLSIYFHVMGRPTSDYTLERLELASAAGCCWISWGIESGSQRLLNLIRKGTFLTDISCVLQNSSQAGITNLMMMIFGLPTSTEKDFQATISFLESVRDFYHAVTSSAFVLFENTHFAEYPRQYGLVPAKNQPVCAVNGMVIDSTRLSHMRIPLSGDSWLSPADEVNNWLKRRQWMGGPPFLETLNCEHLLLYSAARLESFRMKPQKPVMPRVAA